MTTTSPSQRLGDAISAYVEWFARTETTVGLADEGQLFREFDETTALLLRACATYEAEAGAEEVQAARAELKRRTEPWFSQSSGMRHTRHWPRGYQGDYEVLEWIYEGVPQSSTPLGAVLDSYLLSRAMAVAARGRKTELCNILRRELRERDSPAQILSIACGSCRDVFEIAADIQRTGSHVTCVDRDPDAIAYARRLLRGSGLSEPQVTLQQLNALRLVSTKEVLMRFGEQDIVYSVGFLDYLDDSRVSRLLRAWYAILKPGGSLVVAMKDVTRFEPYAYRWLIDWTGFRARTETEMVALLDAADIPRSRQKASRDPSGVIVLWQAVR